MHIDKKRIGQIIHDARTVKRMTQAALAEKIDVTLKTVIDIEKGKRNPTLAVLYGMITVLDIPADLIFRPDEITDSNETAQFISELRHASELEQRMAIAASRGIWQEFRRKSEE